MSTRSEETIRRARRGERVAKVREALALSGEDFAALLRKCLLAAGFETHYDKAKVSRIEGGVRDLSFEEGVMIALLDPDSRPVEWLAYGDLDLARLDTAQYLPITHPLARKKGRKRSGGR